jgi:regulator of sigma E protease
MLTAISFILVFGIIVFFHEFGHFIFARINGIKVHEFSMGMGPKLFSIKKKETVYSLRIFPIGGYVKMEGEDEDSQEMFSFSKKNPYQRFSVIFAGPFMNFVLAIILLTIIGFIIGTPTNIVGEAIDGLPATNAGIISNDEIVSINNVKIKEWEDIVNEISSSENLNIKIIRDSEEIEIELIPIIDEENGRKIIGISPKYVINPIESIKNAAITTYQFSTSLFVFLKDLIVGNEVQGEVLGPVGIVELVGNEAKNGITNLLFLAAYLSVNLGVINLLPFPALDGGRIVFIIVEILRGKPIDPQKEGFVHMIGFTILMGLMVFVLWKDITRLLGW